MFYSITVTDSKHKNMFLFFYYEIKYHILTFSSRRLRTTFRCNCGSGQGASWYDNGQYMGYAPYMNNQVVKLPVTLTSDAKITCVCFSQQTASPPSNEINIQFGTRFYCSVCNGFHVCVFVCRGFNDQTTNTRG